MKASKITYVDFQKKKNITEKSIYNSWYDKWLKIKRACDPSKTIVHEAIGFIASIEFLFTKNPDEVIFNKKLLTKKCIQGPRQRSRYLAQISDLYEITPHTSYNYKGKEYHFVWSAKRTKNSLEILQNPELFYSKMAVNNDLDTRQICLVSKSNMSSTYIDNRNPIEEISSSYARELISKKEKIYKKEKATKPNHTTCSNAILTEHSQVVTTKTSQPVTACDDTNKPKLLTAAEEKAIHLQRMQRDPTEQSEGGLSELMKKIISKQENIEVLQSEVETMPSNNTAEQGIEPPKITQNEEVMKQEETSLIPDKETRKMLLSKAIFDAFGAAANEIQDNCSFEEISPLKVCIKPAIGVSFNDIEKAKIRKCIKSVYGEDVVLALVNTNLYVSKEPVASESGLARNEIVETTLCHNPQWLNFKANVRDRKVREMLANPTMKIIEVQDKVIIEGHAFLLEELLSSGYLQELEDAVVETGLTLEFHEKTVASQYVAKDSKPTILTREKIMKDREWKKTATDDFDDFINELKNEKRVK